MGLADLLLRKHTAIAKVVVPSSMAFGFFYTVNHGTNALSDAKSSLLGRCQSTAQALAWSDNPNIWLAVKRMSLTVLIILQALRALL